MMEEYVAKINETMTEIQKVVAGKEAVIKRVITAILAGGNILLDDSMVLTSDIGFVASDETVPEFLTVPIDT